MRSINNFVLKVGKLALPMSCYKVVEETVSISAKEVTKINGKIYRVQRKPYVVLDDGSSVDVDKSQILKAYEKEDGLTAIFTSEEQSQLFKNGSSREWIAQKVVPKTVFSDLDFQKDGIVAMVELDKKKTLQNKTFLKFFAMLKEGLGEDKAIVTQVLYKNVEYPVAIMNYKDNLLIRFLHYSGEIRDLSGETELPKLTEQEKEQARTFIMQFCSNDFDLSAFENKTEAKIMKLINSRGTEIQEVPAEVLTTENPFL
jgi:non-homologous end joining protein Ku